MGCERVVAALSRGRRSRRGGDRIEDRCVQAPGVRADLGGRLGRSSNAGVRVPSGSPVRSWACCPFAKNRDAWMTDHRNVAGTRPELLGRTASPQKGEVFGDDEGSGRDLSHAEVVR